MASNARFCPRCGRRFTHRLVKLLSWFFGISIAIGVVLAISRQDNPSRPASAADQAQQAKENRQFQAAVVGAKQLMDSMRNPDSFKLSNVLFLENGTICYEYRAQNGFGGMNIGHAILTSKAVLKTTEMEDGMKLWSRGCAGKSGLDKTSEVNYAIGK